MPDIHSTAILEGNVQLADDVVVGPWCRIAGDVTLGPGCVLHERVSLTGPLTVGAGNEFYPGVVIGTPPQDRGFDPAKQLHGVVLGDRNVFRENVSIHRATGSHPTQVGSHCYLMANCHVGHDCVMGDHITFANCVALAGHVTIADRVTFGGNSGVHQFCRIGRLVMVSAITAMMQDVPPFCTAYRTREIGSLNIVGLRRSGYRQHIKPLQEAFRILLQSNLPRPTAVERIRAELADDPLCMEFAEFASTTRRGITRYASRAVDED